MAEMVARRQAEVGVRIADEIRATVDDFRETSPVITFTSIFFGAF